MIQLHLFKRNHRFESLVGKTFGRWTVIAYGGENNYEMKLWWCRCSCGTERLLQRGALVAGETQSCGCLSGELTTSRRRLLEPGKSGFNKVLTAYKHAARGRDLEFDLSIERFTELTQGVCYYCGTPPSTASVNGKTEEFRKHSTYIYNGIDRLDATRGYVTDNCVSCCFVCNRAKYTWSEDEFLKHIKRIYDHRIATGPTHEPKARL